MAEAAAAPAAAARGRGGRLPLWIGLALAPLAAAGGFVAVQQHLASGAAGGEAAAALPAALADIAFLPMPAIVITLGPAPAGRHLRLVAQLEVERARLAEVEAILPRLLDVLNGYLRAVDLAEMEDPAGLLRLRAQMLRRVQMVAGEGRVRDLLVTEFVVN